MSFSLLDNEIISNSLRNRDDREKKNRDKNGDARYKGMKNKNSRR